MQILGSYVQVKRSIWCNSLKHVNPFRIKELLAIYQACLGSYIQVKQSIWYKSLKHVNPFRIKELLAIYQACHAFNLIHPFNEVSSKWPVQYVKFQHYLWAHSTTIIRLDHTTNIATVCCCNCDQMILVWKEPITINFRTHQMLCTIESRIWTVDTSIHCS